MKGGFLKEHESDVELSLFCLHQKAVLTSGGNKLPEGNKRNVIGTN